MSVATEKRHSATRIVGLAIGSRGGHLACLDGGQEVSNEWCWKSLDPFRSNPEDVNGNIGESLVVDKMGCWQIYNAILCSMHKPSKRLPRW